MIDVACVYSTTPIWGRDPRRCTPGITATEAEHNKLAADRPCMAPVVGSQIIPSTEHNPVTVDLYGDALMNLPAPGDAHWRVQHDAIADAFRNHCVHDLGIAVWREVDDLFQQALPLGNTVPRDELKDLVPDGELSLPAFNVVTGSYDPRSLKSMLLEFKTMRYGVKYTAVPRATRTAVDRFERSLLGDIQRGLAARDAAWHNTEPGQKGPLRDILDMSEYTGMVFGTVGEVSKGVHQTLEDYREVSLINPWTAMAALARVAPIASEPARPLAARAPCPRRSSRFVTRAAGSTPPPPTPDFNSRPTAIPPPDADGFGAAGSEPLGAKLDKWMKDPFSLLAMGPRAGLGALTTASEALEKLPELQAELEERVNFVMNDPRPVDEKQELIAKDVEATLAEMIAKGEELETGVLSQFAAQLPPEVMEAIPAELKDAFPGLKTAGPSEDPFADEWETKYDDSYTYTPPPVAPPSSAPPPSSPAARDMMMLKESATSVRGALEAIQQNSDPSKSAMLKVNLKDSRDELGRRVRELGAIQYGDASMSAALAESKKLLEEVDSLRL
eukprot:jgi/Tetstr1/463601/TSEL_000754.t1